MTLWSRRRAVTRVRGVLGSLHWNLRAQQADLYGNKYVGPIHGKLLLASSAASVCGPSLLLSLRQRSTAEAIENLISKVRGADVVGSHRASTGGSSCVREDLWRPN